MNPAIAVDGLRHAFGRRTILHNLDFAVAPGSFFIIIGPNGSGKTTLLKLLAGLLPLQTGRIDVHQRSIKAYSARRLAQQVAYVPQAVSVEFPFRVLQVVLMGRAPHLGVLGFESDRDVAVARQAMESTDVAHLADRRLDQISGGEQQRVYIARAICQQPRIILMDEPTASLDMAHQLRMMDLMERLKTDQNLTVVMVSHDLNLAAMYADQILLLDKGRKACLGSPYEVLEFERLETVYGCTLLVDQSPLGGYPCVHLVPGRYLTGKDPGPFKR
jgi:iron complex transport system ATP-binding protein